MAEPWLIFVLGLSESRTWETGGCSTVVGTAHSSYLSITSLEALSLAVLRSPNVILRRAGNDCVVAVTLCLIVAESGRDWDRGCDSCLGTAAGNNNYDGDIAR
jgi:hypothetical protein